jgi:hypothetical protein
MRQTVSLAITLVWAVGIWLSSVAVSAAPPDDPLEATPAEADAHEADTAATPATPDDAHRTERVAAALLVLGGVVAIGFSLIAVAIIGGARLRRVARQPVRPPMPYNPLWYLSGTPPLSAEPETPRSPVQEAGDGNEPRETST